jgi:peptide-methionine (S)-S-oxide reductase
VLSYEAKLKAKGAGRGEAITTEIQDPGPLFYFAEDYHQQYLAKPGARQYCSAMPTGISLPSFDEWKPAGTDAKAPVLPLAFWEAHGPVPGCTIKGPNAQIVWE